MSYLSNIYVSRRKRSICRLKVSKKNIGFMINNKKYQDYFYESEHHFFNKLSKLLHLFGLEKSFSFSCNIVGGGKSSQGDSVLYALAKALRGKFNEEFANDELSKKKMLKILRDTGYITVDRRKVAPKKYGYIKSRAKEQFVRR